MIAFTSDKSVKEKLTTRTSSGAISFNDAIVHFAGMYVSIMAYRTLIYSHILIYIITLLYIVTFLYI